MFANNNTSNFFLQNLPSVGRIDFCLTEFACRNTDTFRK